MRRLFVWIHRYVGLAMALFLIIEGLTGSLLAFDPYLWRLITPQLYATPKPGVDPLGFAALAERAAMLIPHGRVDAVISGAPDQIVVSLTPRVDPATGRPYELDVDNVYLDPWTGEELGRRGGVSQLLNNALTFIYHVHKRLALGYPGMLALGVVALVWTLDCFVGFYLTLPVTISGFLRRWKTSWLIKWPTGLFRLNFDLHRASGLWLWPILFIFAWSSVYLNLRAVYDGAMHSVLDYEPPHASFDAPSRYENAIPRLDFRAAVVTAERLMEEQASNRGFSVVRPVMLEYMPTLSRYQYLVQSSCDLSEYYAKTNMIFDGDTGAFVSLDLPTQDRSGDWVDAWLFALHMANVFGLPYRIFVCALGLAVTALSVTGVYIWWKKRKARIHAKSHAASAGATRTPNTKTF